MKMKWPILSFSEFEFIKFSSPKHSLRDSETQTLIKNKNTQTKKNPFQSFIWFMHISPFFINQNMATYGSSYIPISFLELNFSPSSHILWIYWSWVLTNSHFLASGFHFHSKKKKSLSPCSPTVLFLCSKWFPQYQYHWSSMSYSHLYHNWWLAGQTI